MENTGLVSQIASNDNRGTNASATVKNIAEPSFGHKSCAPPLSKTQSDGLYLIRQKIKHLGLSRASCDIIMHSWGDKTRRQYSVYLHRYACFCDKHQLDPFQRDGRVVKFLTDMFQRDYGYSAINTARAAVSSISGVGSKPIVCRFMKGVFNLRPPRPRYTHIWDVSTVLQYLRTLSPASELGLLSFSAKLATLIALVTGQRCQTLHALDTNTMHMTDTRAIFHIEGSLKTNAPNNPSTTVTLKAYRQDCRICVFTCLKIYLKRTKRLRSTTKLFISTHSPHAAVTKETVSMDKTNSF